MLNSYGGTFTGLRPTKASIGKHDKESQVLIIKLGELKHLILPKLEEPCKREFFVTAVFDADDLGDVMEHQRNRSVIKLGDFVDGSYKCTFHDHAIILPCKGKSFVRLYLSCISTIEEDEERKIVLNGLSYSDAYKISKLENYREEKTLTLVSDATIATLSNDKITTMVKQGITGGILSFKIETKSSLGIHIPRDVTNNVLETYKNEGKVFSNNSNRFETNKFNSLRNNKSVGKPNGVINSARSRCSNSSSRSVHVADAIKAFEKIGTKENKPVSSKSHGLAGSEFYNPVVIPKSRSLQTSKTEILENVGQKPVIEEPTAGEENPDTNVSGNLPKEVEADETRTNEDDCPAGCDDTVPVEDKLVGEEENIEEYLSGEVEANKDDCPNECDSEK